MKKIINARKVLIIIMMILTSILFIKFFDMGKYDRLFACIIIYPIIFIPNLLNKTKIKLNEREKFIYIIFIFLAQFLGSIVNLYRYIWWYDLFVHFLSGILVFVLANIINNSILNNKLDKFIYYIGFVSFITIFWEVIEFASDCLFNTNMQYTIETGVEDTMQDMIVALIGGIISYIVFFKPNVKSVC